MPQRGVFVITGLPATGKTTLARALARALGAPLIAKDRIKEPLLDVFGVESRAASRRLSDASFAVLFALAAEQLVLVDAVVLEGNFRPGEHEPDLRALLAPHALQSCAQVLCRIPEPLRQARLQARTGDSSRHPGHRDAVWAAAAALDGDAFLDLPGPRLVHDGGTSDPVPACALIHSLANRHLV